jgi:uncharacterized SAM-binding protein YcdF (DUF218 family)
MTDLFFYLSKIFWLVLQPDHFLLLMLILGLLLWRRMLGIFLVWSSVLIMLVISVFPVANYLLEPLEQRFPQPDLTLNEEPIAGIIVLGGGEDAELSAIHGSPQFNQGAERLMVVPGLMLRYPSAKVVFTGGSGSLMKPEYRGGDVAQQWLSQQGLGARSIIERNSRNTLQNALYTRELINEMEEEPTGKWVLVTSAFHMPRSVGVYRHVGIEVIPYPVDYRVAENGVRINLNANMSELNTAVREWIGLVAYHLTDKTSELLPSLKEIQGSDQQ